MANREEDRPLEGKHFLVVAGILWGHVRPAQAFILNLLRLHPTLRITFIMSGIVGIKAAKDKLRYHVTADMEARLRTIHVLRGPKEGAALTTSMEYAKSLGTLAGSFEENYTKIIKGEPITDTVTGKPVFAFSDTPVLVFGDISIWTGTAAMDKVSKELDVPPPKYACLLPVGTNSVHFRFTDVYKDMIKKVCECEDREEGYRKYVTNSQALVTIPNLNPFYLYEFDPNVRSLFIFDVWKALFEMTARWDYMVNVWPACLDREHAEFLQENVANEEHFSVGPQFPPDSLTGDSGEFCIEGEEGEIKTFLDKYEHDRGKRSVIYISFGSLEYPPTEEQIRIVISTLDELDVPYILAHGQPPENISAILPSLVQASGGRGLLSTWVKQMEVLRHPAILGFITHGGSSSCMESLICGVPMLQWPSVWDQPEIANEMDFRGVAHELLQFRGAHLHGKPTARGPTIEGTPEAMHMELTEAIQMLRGPKGDEMRGKVRQLGRQIEEDVAPGGASYEMLVKIGNLCG